MKIKRNQVNMKIKRIRNCFRVDLVPDSDEYDAYSSNDAFLEASQNLQVTMFNVIYSCMINVYYVHLIATHVITEIPIEWHRHPASCWRLHALRTGRMDSNHSYRTLKVHTTSLSVSCTGVQNQLRIVRRGNSVEGISGRA